MIKIISQGNYKLTETKAHHKILYLRHEAYAWIDLPQNGEILVSTHATHKTDEVLAIGRYFVFMVKDEPHVTDLLHLELEVGEGHWQGYLLPTGFPSISKPRSSLIATHELIHDKLSVSPGHFMSHVHKPSLLDVI